MLVTFRVKDIETKLHSKPAQIRPQELAALMRARLADRSGDSWEPGVVTLPGRLVVGASVASLHRG